MIKSWLFESYIFGLYLSGLSFPFYNFSSACGDGPIVLILAPTEERARQIQQECTKFAAAHILALLDSEMDCYKNSLVACGRWWCW